MPGTPIPPVFYYDIPLRLDSATVKLTPFIPMQHAENFHKQSSPSSQAARELYRYLPFGPFKSAEDFTNSFFKGKIEQDPSRVLFAVIDKTREARDHNIDSDGTLAGIIGYLNTDPKNLCTEVGFVIILPAYQRTHVGANAVGILLKFALDTPVNEGLCLRRVAYKCNAHNEASTSLALRMGFNLEGELRWERTLRSEDSSVPKEGNGIQVRDEDPEKEVPSRNTCVFGLCWDEWGGPDGGKRVLIEQVMSMYR